MRDEVFDELKQSEGFNPSMLNQILSLELVDKAHLAAMSALIRTKRWADAICLMHEANNLLGWASSARGLLESAGDIVDGLVNVVPVLAGHHGAIALGLSGRASSQVYDFSETENLLDHYVLAKWMRVKSGEESVLKAKDNAAYVGRIEKVLPGALKFYQRMCGIAHPSSASIEYLYDFNVEAGGRLKLTTTNDAKQSCSHDPQGSAQIRRASQTCHAQEATLGRHKRVVGR